MTYDRRLVPGILADLCSEYGLFVSLVGDVGGLQFMVKRSRQPLNVVEDGGYVCDVVLYPVCGAGRVRRRVDGLKICFLPNANMFFLVDSETALLGKLGFSTKMPQGPFSSIYLRGDADLTPSFYVGYLESGCVLARVICVVDRDADIEVQTKLHGFEYCDPEFPDNLYDGVLDWLGGGDD
jgi:hypothetical protein